MEVGPLMVIYQAQHAFMCNRGQRAYCLGLTPVSEVDPWGGVPRLGWGGEEGRGRGGRRFQVPWHGGVPGLCFGLPELAQVYLSC